MKNNIVIIALSLLLIGCATRREKAITYMQDNPKDLADLCASNFPPKVEYREGKTIHKTDTQYVKGDKIPCPPNEKGEVVYVRGRDMIIRDTVYRTDTASIRDLARERLLQDEIQDLTKKNVKLESKIEGIKKARNISFWVNGIFLVLGLGYAAVKRYIP